MAVKIRLKRRGRKKLPIYDVIVADARAPRDGRYIENIGSYNPNTNPASIILNEEKALYWVMTGAQPTNTVRAMLSYKGVMMKKHLQVGVNKGAVTQEVADQKFEAWKASKENKVQGKVDSILSKKDLSKKEKFDREAKKSSDRAEKISQRKIAETQVPTEDAEASTDANEETAE